MKTSFATLRTVQTRLIASLQRTILLICLAAASITAYAAGPTATISDYVISGVVGLPLTNQSCAIDLSVGNLPDNWLSIVDVDASGWFSFLPNGVTAMATAWRIGGDEGFGIVFSGTPTAASSTTLNITIPGSVLKSGAPIQVTQGPETVELPKIVITDSPTAVINDVTISGKPNTTLTTQTARVTLANATLEKQLETDNATSWFTGLPTGVTVTASSSSYLSKIITLTFKGTPTAESSALLNITIPANVIEGTLPLTVTENPNAKFNITPLLPTVGSSNPNTGPWRAALP